MMPSPHVIATTAPDYEQLHPFFGWLPTDVIKRTFEVMTQYAHMPMSTILKKRYKSPNPALNVHHHNKPVAIDTVYSPLMVGRLQPKFLLELNLLLLTLKA